MKNTISVCQFHSYRLHLLYSIYQLPQIRENTLYVLSGLAYLAKHNGFQFHSRCCKRISFYIMAEQYSTVSISFFSVFSHVLMDICIAQHIILVHFRWFTHVLAQTLYFYLALHQNIQAVFKKFMKHNYQKNYREFKVLCSKTYFLEIFVFIGDTQSPITHSLALRHSKCSLLIEAADQVTLLPKDSSTTPSPTRL